MIRRWLVTLLCLAALAAGSGVRQAAAQPGEAEGSPTIRFRRVFVPAASREDWPLGRQKYLPVAPEEFERLLAASVASTVAADGPAMSPRVAHAEYEARLDGDRLTAGRGVLQVEHPSPSRALLRLEPCGLAVRSAVWPQSESSRPAALGLGVDGSLDVLVEQAGPLEIGWSLAGRRDPAGVLTFPIRLPASPVNRLLLNTSDDVEITVDRGAVLDIGRDDDGNRRWQIELGNRFEFALRVAALGSGAPRPGLALVRERTGYDISLRGVEVSTEWNLEIHHEPVSQIGLELDGQLQLVTATLGEEPIPWTISPGEEGQAPRVVLRLPKPIQGTGLVLRLGALAPRVAGRSWRLPRIQPQDIFWQEGSATLSVRSPLVVQRFTPIGCRQTGTEALASPRRGESFQLQLFHPEATVELDLIEDKDRVEMVSGTSVQWGDEEVRARVRADFRLQTGTRFQLAARLAAWWMVDAVESTPADAVDQWAIESDGQDGRRLVVRLARPLAAGRPIRLSVDARRLGSSVGESLEIQAFAPLDFDDAASGWRLVGLRTPDAYELEHVGAVPGYALSRDPLSPSEAELLDADESMAVFRLDGAAKNPQVRLKPRRPRFLAQMDVELRVGEGVLQEEYRIRCEPESARLDRVVVWMSRQREEPLQWGVEGEETVRVSARRWTPEEQLAAGRSIEGEVWELRLSPPVREAIVLTARRESAYDDVASPSLASVPDAETQTGLLEIHAAPGAAIQIDNRRLRPVPPEPWPADRYATVRAVYRYDPWREVGRVGEPAVIVSGRAAGQAAALASVWEARLDSRFDTDGTGCHVAVFHVENLGYETLRIHLPHEMRTDGPVEVWVDRQRVTATGIRAGAGRPEAGATPWARAPYNELRVSLPPGRKYPTVTLLFTSKQRRLLPIGALQAPWPEPDLPILNRSWTVWLPPGYVAYGGRNAFLPVPPPSRHWSERLLGPLGRADGQNVFDPLAAEDWGALRGDAADRLEAMQRVEGWLQQAAATPAAGEAGAAQDPPARLLALLTHESLSGLKGKLLVDPEALARHGIVAGGGAGPASPERTAKGWLARSGLALLVCRDAALLTSQTDAARLQPHLDATPIASVWWIASRPLARRLGRVADDDAVFVPAEVWVARHGTPSLRSNGRPSRQDSVDQFGWQAVSPLDGGGAVDLRYYHDTSIQLAGSLAFLLAVSGGWWLARHRTMALLGTACAAGLVGLWIPDPYIPVASGIVLGALFCLAFRLVQRRAAPRPRRRRSAVPGVPSTVSAAVPWGLALLVATAAAGWGAAVHGEDRTLETGTAMHRVFIPVDNEQKTPVGAKYLLPEPFFAELHRRAAARRDLPQGWLLGEATYRGELVREPVGERFLVDQIRAQFNLHVFSPSARVHIPLERSSANLLPDGVSLDGRAVEVEWSADHRALVLEVAEPGQYQVELRMRPRMHAAPQVGFDLSIPPLPMAQFELALPSAAPHVEVPTARGATRREEEPPRVVAELGPSDMLSVRWPSGSGSFGPGPAIDIEELLWMKVQPGSVLIEAKWKLTVVEGQVRRLRLATDPRLRLLPLEGERSPAVKTLSGDSELLQLVFEWPEPLQEETTVSARFLLTGTSGVANLRMPQLDVLDGRMTRRWMAVSVAEALQFERSGVERLSPIPAPEFAAAWGAAESPPSFAYRLPAGTPDWTIATRPRESRMSVENELTLRLAGHATEVELKAKLETTSGYGFYYRIAAPDTLKVTRAALLVEGVDRAVRWSQDGDGVIHLFLDGPVSGTQQLDVHGRLPGALGQGMTVPDFRVEGGQPGGTLLHVLRTPGILVEVRGMDGPVPTAAPAAESENPHAWLPVGSFRLAPGAQRAATVVATANEPKLAGMEILRLSAVDGVWHARWECRLDIRDGLLEDLSVDGPANWGNRFRTSDGVELSRQGSVGERQELTIRPRQPVKDRWWAWVSGRLPFAPGEPVAMPHIAMRGTNAVAKFVILPRRIDGRAMDWQIQGLQRVPLDQVAPELAPEQGVLAAFRVVGEPFSAELPESPAVWDEGRVHLAEYALAWREGDSVAGVARFDIEPGTEPSCAIRFPETSRPILVKVDGAQAPMADPPESGVVRIQLGAPGVPQRVEAVFAIDLARGAAGPLEMALPRMMELPVEKTLWTFAAPPGRIAGTSEVVHETTAGDLTLARLERLSSLIDRYIAAAGDDSPDTNRWYRMWLGHWVAAREASRMEAARLPEETDRRVAGDRIEALTEQQRVTAARLGAAEALDQLLGTAGSEGYSETWHAALFRGRSPVYHKVGGNLPKWTVHVAPLPVTPVMDRLLATVGWMALFGLVAVGLRRGWLVEACRRWPQALGVLAGLAWWLWLSPSVLGLLLVVACAATSLQAGWRSVSGPIPDASAVSVRTSHLHGR